MSPDGDPRRDGYDVVIVGTGLGGLTAAAVLARSGLSVLAVEQAEGPGGSARGFRRGDYMFDPAVHVTVEAGPGRPIPRLLEWLGVGGACEFVQLDLLCHATFPDFELRLPVGPEQCIAALEQQFPGDAAGVRDYVETQQRFFREGLRLPFSVGLSQLGEAVEQLPTFFRYRSSTVGDVIEEKITDERARAAVAWMWPYCGIPPSRLAFGGGVPFSATATEGGFWYCLGGFGRLADALAEGFSRNGGELLTGTSVESIELDDGRVTGVVLDGDRRVGAQTVVSGADGRETFERLIGVEHLPKMFVRRLGRLKPTLSAVTALIATTLDLEALGAPAESFLFPGYEHDETFRDASEGRGGGMWASVPTLLDRSVAPDGEHIIVLTSLAPLGVDKNALADTLLERFERAMFPELRDNLSHFEVAGPEDFSRELATRDGSIYGWALTPQQLGSKRLPHSGTLDGLWLAGHWTEEGSGSFRAILSGVTAAQSMLRAAGAEVDPTMFRPDDLPEIIGH